MSAIRQQRNFKSPRALRPAFTRVNSDMVAALQVTGLTGIQLTLANAPTPLVFSGVLQVKCESTGEFPTTMAVAGNIVTLTYAAYFPNSAIFTLAANDPAVRTRVGAFIAPFNQSKFDPPLQDWTPGTSGSPTLNVSATVGELRTNGGDFGLWRNNTKAELANSIAQDGARLNVIFTTTVDVGDEIELLGLTAAMWATQGALVRPAKVLAT